MKYQFNKPIFKVWVQDNLLLSPQNPIQALPSTKQSTTINQMNQHMQNSNSTNRPQTNNDSINLTTNKRKHILKYLCLECNKNCRSKVNFKRHMKSHDKPK